MKKKKHHGQPYCTVEQTHNPNLASTTCRWYIHASSTIKMVPLVPFAHHFVYFRIQIQQQVIA